MEGNKMYMRIKIFLIVISIILSLVVFYGSIHSMSSNRGIKNNINMKDIIVNGDFENKEGSGYPSEWFTPEPAQQNGTATIDSTVKVAGRSSVRMESNVTGKEKKPLFFIAQRIFPLEFKGKQIVLKGYLRSEGIKGNIVAIVETKEGKESFRLPKNTKGKFEYFRKTLKAPKKRSYVLLILAVVKSEGTVWFDDVHLMAETMIKETKSSEMTKRKIDKITPIPSDADIVYISRIHGKGKKPPAPAEVYVMNADGRNITRITYSNGKKSFNHVSVSPDRKMLVAQMADKDTNGNGFLEEKDDQKLWVLDIANKVAWAITDGKVHVSGPEWSPDGSRILVGADFERNKPTDIYTIKSDGTELTNLTNTPKAGETDVAWSKDGSMITYVRADFKNRKNRVWIMNVDGSGQRQLTDGGQIRTGKLGRFLTGDYDPEFSPDGKHVVFGRLLKTGVNKGVGIHNIFVVDVNGRNLKNLTNVNSAAEFVPGWSYDGKKIIFTVFDTERKYGGLMIINADGSRRQRLLTDIKGVELGGSLPRWIPKEPAK
jgi:Tol biopolymer transport system component